MEWHKLDVDDKSVKVGGKQRILSPDRYHIPLNVESGLPYMPMRPYTDEEFDTLPALVLTSDGEWDPSVLDHNLTDDDQWFDAISDFPDETLNNPFDLEGNYKAIHIVTEAIFHDAIPDKPPPLIYRRTPSPTRVLKARLKTRVSAAVQEEPPGRPPKPRFKT